MMSRTTRITIETESLLLVRQGRTVMTWCPECCAEVEAIVLDGQSSAGPFLSKLSGAPVHTWTPARGTLQICLPSLLQHGRPEDVQQVHIPERMLPNKGEGR